MKKVLSLVLVLAMVLSSMSFAFAGTFTDVADTDYEDAINTLVGLGVVTGYEDGTFRAEKVVTRAEMAKLIVEVLGYGDLVAGSKSNFADTQGHWADSWIALAAGKGLVVGTGEGKFTPDRTVSYDEAITMVVRALGYTDTCNELKGMTWPTNFKVKAAELKLTKDVVLASSGADRGGVAQLIYNALEATLVTVTTDGDVTFLQDTISGDKVDRILLSRLAEIVGTKDVPFVVDANNIDPDHKNYKGDIVDLTPYLYQDITAYVNDDGDVVYVKDVNVLTFEGTVTDVDGTTITVEDVNEDAYDFKITSPATIEVYYNGAETDCAAVNAAGKLLDSKVIIVLDAEDNDKLEDDILVTGIVAKNASGIVRVEDLYEKGDLFIDEVFLPEDDDEVDFDNLTVKGDATSLEDVKEDDILTIYVPFNSDDVDTYFVSEDADKMEIVVTRNTINGVIAKVDVEDEEVFVGGKAYEINDLGYVTFADLETEVGSTVTLFLDDNGNVVDFDLEDGSNPEDYAIVLEVKDGVKIGNTTVADPKIKVLTASGEEVTYVLDTQESGSSITFGTTSISDNVKEVLGVGFKDLIKYNVNSDGEIDIAVKQATTDTISKTTGNSFNLASNAVIFSVPNGVTDEDDIKVISEEDLADTITAYKIMDGTKIEALVVSAGASIDNIFGIVSSDSAKIYDEDEDKTVVLYTTYVDGVKVEYLGESTTKVATKDALVKLTVTDGKLSTTSTEVVADTSDIKVATGTAINAKVTTAITTVEGSVHYLADDVVVYVMEDGEFDSVGTKADIRGNVVKMYNTTPADDDDINIVVVYTVTE